MSWIRFGKIALVLLAMGTAAGVHADTIWIDVRSPLEHSIDSIDQDAFIPHDRIVEDVSKTFPDKDADIRLYCLSGGRAERAKSALEAAGYTNVSNVGGIEDARRVRGLEQ